MFALIADQKGSRRSPDAVGDAIALLMQAEASGTLRFALPPERTSGDEFQCLFADADSTYSALRILARDGRWHIGLGVGAVECPLPESVRESRGPALVFARQAVEAAKSQTPSIVVIGEGDSANEANGALQLMALPWEGRTQPGWSAVTAIEDQDEGTTLSEVAAELGISKQALSQRLRVANWQVEQRTKGAVIRSLVRADHQESGDSQ